MTVTAYPINPSADATSLIVYSGEANVAVSWSCTTGTIAPLVPYTDSRGIAGAIFTPGLFSSSIITVQHGT